uniref:RNA-directed DNA polymerase, eukaryota, reverse transcriptase zinc-binding domain protein n=1 Tax=Tanacetum cinerariifolium TaxID=118510 RepID=A0A6L2L7R4_TANCI|nr:RNA-directed DNA polymerase, eukaryota, reverse transcriptase zinc-binding domain protein [Tanacetum cinerariifolium]
MVDASNVDDSVMDGDKLRSSFASKIRNVDGKILGKDGKPMRRAIRFVEPVRVSDPPPVAHANVKSTSPLSANGNSFASVLQHKNVKNLVKVSELRNSEKVQGAAVAIPLEAVKEVSARFDNTLYGYFVGKKLAFHLSRIMPWCLFGDFNAAIFLSDSTTGSSSIDIAMREFKECVDAIEVADVQSSEDVPTNGEADGFVEVKKKKKAKGPSNAKQIGNDDTTWLHAKQSLSVINESDSEEVDQVIEMEQNNNLVGSTHSKRASTPVDNVSDV